jgi:putative FmdB family regulatory protein
MCPSEEWTMATIKLVCQQCKHAFTVSTRGAIKDKQKSCPECRSHEVRQTLGSFLSNGPLSSSTCGAVPTGGFG